MRTAQFSLATLLGASVFAALAACGPAPSTDCSGAYQRLYPYCYTDASTLDATEDGSAVDALGPDQDGAEMADGPSGPEAGGDVVDAGDAGDGSGCTAPLSLSCNGTCEDPTLPAHCGSCTNACTAPANATATCSSSFTCGFVCGAAFHTCNGACLPNTDLPAAASDPCVLSSVPGVFVAPAPIGSDSNPGTMTAPVATLGHAMDLAVSGTSKRVYACGSAGRYTTENLAVTASRDGVAVYGGLNCSIPSSWSYDATQVAIVAPAATGYALTVSGLTAGVTFEDFAFTSQPTTAAGASSIAVFVASASNVVFARAAMTAGSATGTGAAGATATNHASGVLDGNSASGTTPGAQHLCTCGTSAGATSTGGQGGSSTQDAGVGLPAYGGGAAGMNGVSCNVAGASGADGLDPAMLTADTPSTALGTLSASGWVPATGALGSTGKPGQGGGGGGDRTAPGGGGACGGCGGAGGKPGGGGGSSIALLSYQSTVTLQACTLTAGNASAGGKGGDGEAGQAGGGGGIQVTGGCPGGNGASGAGGNGAQGGPGGVSLGIGYSGTAPTADSMTQVSVGTAGAGGAGGMAGPAATTPPTGQPVAGNVGAVGQAGVAQATPKSL